MGIICSKPSVIESGNLSECECYNGGDWWGLHSPKCKNYNEESNYNYEPQKEPDNMSRPAAASASKLPNDMCTCCNCRCGKRHCWICGSGSIPNYYKPCVLHEVCKFGYHGCEGIILQQHLNTNETYYIIPLDKRHINSCCEKCRIYILPNKVNKNK
jgi:hypothetical protein